MTCHTRSHLSWTCPPSLIEQDDADLDAGEAFERMQLSRIMATNPDSAAYHAAMRKSVTASPGRVAPGGPVGGVKAQAQAMRRREHEQAIAAGLVKS